MKAVLLAAGRGKRLGNAAHGVPKPMVAVRGKPVLEHNVAWLRAYGITDIAINLHHLPGAVRGHFGDGSGFGVKISYSVEKTLLGTAGGVRKIHRELWGDSRDPFLVAYGDNLFDLDLGSLIAAHADAVATIALYELDDVSQSGIAVLDEAGRIADFIEKPRPGRASLNPQEARQDRASAPPGRAVGGLVNMGLYVMEAEALDGVPEGAPCDFGRDVFPRLARAGRLKGVRVDGGLTAIDTPGLLERATGRRP